MHRARTANTLPCFYFTQFLPLCAEILELAQQFVYALAQVQFCRRSLQVKLIEEPVNCPIVKVADRPPRHGAKVEYELSRSCAPPARLGNPLRLSDVSPHHAPQRASEAGRVREALPRGDNQADDFGAAFAFGRHGSQTLGVSQTLRVYLFTHNLRDDLTVARADVKVYVDDLLPRAQQELSADERDDEGCTQE